MEEEINQLKSILRSLVVSSPSQMDVRSLLRDYREMMGAHVPLNKFGYKEPLTFLKERCNDCFLFTGPPSNPILTLIVPDTLKHIDKFVQKQKSSVTTKHKAKRRSVPHSIIEPPKPNLIVETFNKKKVEHLDNTTKPEVKPPDIKPPPTSVPNGVDDNHTHNDGNHHHVSEKVEENEIIVEHSQENHSVTRGSIMALHNFLKKRMPLYDSMDSEKFTKENNYSKDDIDSGRQTLSSNNSSKKLSKFEQLKGEIREVIYEHPEGVLCTDLMRLYREKYGKELEFTQWGYTCIVSVVYALGDAVSLIRLEDNSDWLARPPPAAPEGAPAPAPPAPRLRRLVQRYQHATGNSTPTFNGDDALPGIQYDPDVFPEDCMQFHDSLQPAPLADVRRGSLLEVMVGEVYSPSHFWLMRLGEEYHIAMDEMMDEMTEYYERGEGKSRELARGAVRPGQYCAKRYERDWHRALVVRELDADTVKVRLVDYGTVEQTSWRSLRPLPRRWAALAQQAVRARLAGVAPRARGWPRAASRHLLRRVQQRHLVAHVANIDTQENILEVFLVDTSGEDDVCLATEMIRSGHAEPRGESCLLTSECYLYPRFDALETGATPNFGEIERYLRDGIALQYVEDYRRHVPVDLPPSPPAPPAPPTPPTPSPSTSPSIDAHLDAVPSPLPSPPPSPSLGASLTRLPLLRVEAESQTCLSSPPQSSPSSSPPPPTAPSGAAAPSAPANEEVRLSLMECEMYRELCASSPMAAQWFMVGALTRALHASSLSLSSPAPPPAPAAPLRAPAPAPAPAPALAYPHEPRAPGIPQARRGPLLPTPPHGPYPPYGGPLLRPPHGSYPPPAICTPHMPHPPCGPHVYRDPYLQFAPYSRPPVPFPPQRPRHPGGPHTLRPPPGFEAP